MSSSLLAAARFSWRCVALGLGLGLAGCGGSDDPARSDQPRPGSRDAVEAAIQRAMAGEPGEVKFAAELKPVFAEKCVYCHHTANVTGVDLTRPFDAAVGIVGRPSSRLRSEARLLVDPGNPRNSFVLDKVIRDNLAFELEGNAMPFQIPMLGAEAISAIRGWISAGAADDASFRSDVAPIFAERCVYCHNPNSAQEPDLTQPFDSVVGIVKVAAGNGVRVVPGDPDASLLVKDIEAKAEASVPMPFHPERLTEAEVSVLVRWISQGAPNN
ncbi:MAG: hypothetical protein M3020_03465 [Myxococcota bacterium]|nr:hypothetical protein [Myxococcota bacterium]